MLDRVDWRPPKKDSEPHLAPTELAFRIGFAMLLALCIALLAQFAAAPPHGLATAPEMGPKDVAR